MKIDRVKLRHFRSHENTVLAFERVSFIRGMNKTGKSSVAMAIEMALSGRCAVTDEGGKGFEKLIQEGHQAATVTLECSNVNITLTLDRSTGRTLKIETEPGTKNARIILGKQAQEWLAENVGTPDVINATMNAWRFMSLSDSEQMSLLARVLLPAKLELNADVSTWLAGSNLAVVERSTLFSTIEATHKLVASARTDVNRQLRDLKTLVEPEPLSGDSAATKTKLKNLQADQKTLNERLRVLSNAEAVAAESVERLARIDKEIATLIEKLPALREKMLTQPQRKELETKAMIRDRQTEVRALLANERNNLAHLVATLSHDDQAVCPTCRTAIDAATREELYAPFRAREVESRATVERLELELRAALDGETAAKQLSADNANRQICRDTEVALERWQEQHDSIKATPAVVIESGDEETASLRLQLLELETRISKGTDVLVRIVTLEEQHAVYRRQIAERERAETQLVELEKLLEYFGPKGIKAKLIAERLDLFTERVNAVLDQWNYSLDFTIEPYSLKITEIDAETGEAASPLVPSQLSASERYRLGVAFGMAIADWTGTRLLIADGADILDKDDKWKLAQAFLQSDLVQAIMTSTGVAGTFEADGTAFYTLSKVGGISATEVDAITTMSEETALRHG
jgi:DNA repair exonuclease SbcCD ATPase subunit